MIDVGQVYPAELLVTDENGAPANPVSAVLTITLPDGTTVSPSVQLPPAVTGTVRYDYPTVQAGLHKASWQTTSPQASGVDYFNVRNFISIFSLKEAMDHLNETRLDADGIAELRRFMMGATELIESKVGIIVRRQFTDRVNESPAALLIPHKPILDVVSVKSVWAGGPTWDSTQVEPDRDAGIIYTKTFFPFWWGPWDVTYHAGVAEPPERWLHAGKEQLRHLWETQRGAQPPAVLQGEEVFTATAGWSFSVPRRVLELIEQDMVPSS